MNEILIVSPDRVFARMLFLELERADTEIKVVSGKVDIRSIIELSGSADLVVYDADYAEGDMALLHQINAPCVLFSKVKLEGCPKNTVGVFERPFDVSEFVSFVYSHLTSGEIMQQTIPQIKNDGLTFDRASKRFTFGDTVIELTPKEYDLLYLLYKNRGKAVLRKDVLDTVWGEDYDDKNNADNVYISYLRRKLDDAFGVKMIYTIRGKGYMLK